MSLYNKIIGDRNSKVTPETGLDWKPLTEIKQLDEIAEESATIPVVIFKHSTTCGISRMALKNFERDYTIPGAAANIYILDLLEYREISKEIADRFGVTHQSPQILLIKDGKAIYDASHSDIDADALSKKIAGPLA
ncbi:MAG TPA: bacillithiol system redox-active protein YtxJ [Flavobacterium sp.]|jgi:bacillithiol system protein YtxJ